MPTSRALAWTSATSFPRMNATSSALSFQKKLILSVEISEVDQAMQHSVHKEEEARREVSGFFDRIRTQRPREPLQDMNVNLPLWFRFSAAFSVRKSTGMNGSPSPTKPPSLCHAIWMRE